MIFFEHKNALRPSWSITLLNFRFFFTFVSRRNIKKSTDEISVVER